MHKTNCMQSIENISTWEVFSSICPSYFTPLETNQKKLDISLLVLCDRKTLAQFEKQASDVCKA